MAYKDKRSKPGLYYGSDGLIKDPSDPTGKRWIEDPKTFVPVKKASNSVNELSKLFDRQQGALIGLRQLRQELFGEEEPVNEEVEE